MTTVDAVTARPRWQREDVSQKQVAVADRIVLTKLDLAGDDEAVLRAESPHSTPGRRF